MIYNYNKDVNVEILESEIRQSSITVALDYITLLGTSLSIIFKASLSQQEETDLDTIVADHVKTASPDIPLPVEVDSAPPFAAKTIKINNITKKLFKRVHGKNATIGANQTSTIDFTVPYAWAKFTGAEINGCNLGDSLNFTVHDTANNDISGLDPQVYGANVQLNKFGFDVEMPENYYRNTSDYDADLHQNMIIRCVYTNNSQSSKYVSLNFWLHEVKD